MGSCVVLVLLLGVDGFTTAFKSNRAAACIFEEEREEEWLLAVAREFNISEACYLAWASGSESVGLADGRSSPRFRLRCFTPVDAIDLCGNATLAAVHTLFTSGMVDSDTIEFITLSGILTAKGSPETKSSDNSGVLGMWIELDFPVVPISQYDDKQISCVSEVLNGTSIVEIKKTANGNRFHSLDCGVCKAAAGKEVEELQPQFDEIQRCPGRGIIITGLAQPDSGFDFLSRFFCPKLGVNKASPRGGVVKVHLDELNVAWQSCNCNVGLSSPLNF